MDNIVATLLPIDAAAGYLREVLACGGADGDRVPVTGSIHALAPEGAAAEALLSFDRGGLLEQPDKISDGRYLIQAVPNTIAAAAVLVWEGMARCEQPVLWVHEPLWSEAQIAKEGLSYRCSARRRI